MISEVKIREKRHAATGWGQEDIHNFGGNGMQYWQWFWRIFEGFLLVFWGNPAR